jgi:tetratricopeptide (TPR) repeat protein
MLSGLLVPLGTGSPRAHVARAWIALLLGAATAGANPPLDVPLEARAAWDGGRRIEAVELAVDALRQRPDDRALRTTLVSWEIAVHRYRSAWEHLASLDASYDGTRGRVLYLLGRYAEALELLDGSRPEDALARLDALEVLGRVAEARAALDDAARVLGDDDARVRSWRGRMLAREGRHTEAIALFRAALASDPLDQAARFGLGRALLAVGEREAALEVLAEHRRLAPLIDRYDFACKSLDLAPASAGNHAALGDCERLLARPARARAAYETAERLAGPGEVAAVVLRFARFVREDEDDLAGAIAILERGLEREPDARLLVRAGDYLVEAGRSAAAVRRFEEALALRPDDGAIATRLRTVSRPRREDGATVE